MKKTIISSLLALSFWFHAGSAGAQEKIDTYGALIEVTQKILEDFWQKTISPQYSTMFQTVIQVTADYINHSGNRVIERVYIENGDSHSMTQMTVIDMQLSDEEPIGGSPLPPTSSGTEESTSSGTAGTPSTPSSSSDDGSTGTASDPTGNGDGGSSPTGGGTDGNGGSIPGEGTDKPQGSEGSSGTTVSVFDGYALGGLGGSILSSLGEGFEVMGDPRWSMSSPGIPMDSSIGALVAAGEATNVYLLASTYNIVGTYVAEYQSHQEKLLQYVNDRLTEIAESTNTGLGKSQSLDRDRIKNQAQNAVDTNTADTAASSLSISSVNQSITDWVTAELGQGCSMNPQEPPAQVDTASPENYVFSTPKSDPNYKDLAKTKRYLDSIASTVDSEGGQYCQQRKQLLGLANIDLDLADISFTEGRSAEGKSFLNRARAIGDMVLDFVPVISSVKDLITIATGINPLTQEKASNTERAILGSTFFAPAITSGTGKAVVKTVRALDKLIEFGNDSAKFAPAFRAVVKGAENELAHLSKTTPGSELGKVVDDIVDALPKSDSKVLGRNLEKAGVVRPDGTAAHHIIAGKHPLALESQMRLRDFGIDINDAANGFFLPCKGTSCAPGAWHPSLHTAEYFKKVNTETAQATSKEEIIEIIEDIRNRLLEDKF